MTKANGLTKFACIFLLLSPLALAQNQHAFVWSSATGNDGHRHSGRQLQLCAADQ